MMEITFPWCSSDLEQSLAQVVIMYTHWISDRISCICFIFIPFPLGLKKMDD